ncbi:UvrD-helicase domain-containing protein [Micromonospora marina]|uniref:UvrD-helicase domain-containing protein n=1 Tax=Micromonospora marina TaxID=307120 RepID=UPI003D75671A
MPAHALQPAGLTGEQLRAAAAVEPGVFIEAAPGSGKTTVAAERFGYLRYRDPGEPRATVALSFTRAATAELRRRVVRTWGVDPLRGPHRVVTIDTFLQELLTFLLRAGHLHWPGGHTDLTVKDTWDNTYAHNFTRYQPVLAVSGRDIVVSAVFNRKPQNHIDNEPFTKAISGGICTHDDVRKVLTAVFADDQLQPILGKRLRATVAHLIVDEVFDANRLDVLLIALAAAHQIEVTVIGDPWQALYQFRGAEPELVHQLITACKLRTYPLTRSFRFQTTRSQNLATDLRTGKGVVLPTRGALPLDMVLAHDWNTLWQIGQDVLPLSFGSPRTAEKAAALLLLDIVTVAGLGQHAVFVGEALQLLRITDPDAPARLAPRLSDVLSTLRPATTAAVNDAWDALVAAIATESARSFRPRRANYTRPLAQLGDYLRRAVARPVPGLTIHQAKGREWSAVGVRLTPTEQQHLAAGLAPDHDGQRAIYVALTRGKADTVAV